MIQTLDESVRQEYCKLYQLFVEQGDFGAAKDILDVLADFGCDYTPMWCRCDDPKDGSAETDGDE